MAEIVFGGDLVTNLQGSGLGFYGSTFGSSVQIGSYQSKTHITNDNGTTNGGAVKNVKFGGHAATGIADAIVSGVPLVRLYGSQRTLDIHFIHSTPVNVQNAQFRIYDRVNINNPASGVNTKVAELVNFSNVSSYSNGFDTFSGPNVSPNENTADAGVYGSGDLFWWGEPWPASTQGYYQNSVGIKFYNGVEGTDTVTNGDVRLQSITGGDDTVGGSGVIVPLLDSPGSGGRYLHPTLGSLGAQKFVPKWRQYYDPGYADVPNIGARGATGATYNTFGGTGVDTRHTWRLALSATPLSIGSKEQYGAYVSLEYL